MHKVSLRYKVPLSHLADAVWDMHNRAQGLTVSKKPAQRTLLFSRGMGQTLAIGSKGRETQEQSHLEVINSHDHTALWNTCATAGNRMAIRFW